ncbi:hypothetical protein K491DRAFT_685626 [Lophiostoma macrostomum CBS 122681]|uniref:Uncharacterized protein n=1 Tax=Lophiostoma macrostomum CBS 122681 TaxID=1314788 RepID=A0A6A6SHH2_9PLEO|nr:hypothetical protein K491DRAFT_685626 [Lophiostoma macrostomum CBS 122681]
MSTSARAMDNEGDISMTGMSSLVIADDGKAAQDLAKVNCGVKKAKNATDGHSENTTEQIHFFAQSGKGSDCIFHGQYDTQWNTYKAFLATFCGIWDGYVKNLHLHGYLSSPLPVDVSLFPPYYVDMLVSQLHTGDYQISSPKTLKYAHKKGNVNALQYMHGVQDVSIHLGIICMAEQIQYPFMLKNAVRKFELALSHDVDIVTFHGLATIIFDPAQCQDTSGRLKNAMGCILRYNMTFGGHLPQVSIALDKGKGKQVALSSASGNCNGNTAQPSAGPSTTRSTKRNTGQGSSSGDSSGAQRPTSHRAQNTGISSNPPGNNVSNNTSNDISNSTSHDTSNGTSNGTSNKTSV